MQLDDKHFDTTSAPIFLASCWDSKNNQAERGESYLSVNEGMHIAYWKTHDIQL